MSLAVLCIPVILSAVSIKFFLAALMVDSNSSSRQSLSPEPQEVQFGQRLRRARKAKGMRLHELAEAAGCSESMISKIENGKARPSLTTLHALCRVLDTTIASFFSSNGGSQIVSQQGTRPILSTSSPGSPPGIRFERIVPAGDGRQMEANIHIIPPGVGTKGKIVHEGEEFGYVITGELELTVDQSVYILREGDSFSFYSDTPHGYRNPSRGETRVLWANTPPTF